MKILNSQRTCTPARRNIWSSTANIIPITSKATTECKLVIGEFRYYVYSAESDIHSRGFTMYNIINQIFLSNYTLLMNILREISMLLERYYW